MHTSQNSFFYCTGRGSCALIVITGVSGLEGQEGIMTCGPQLSSLWLLCKDALCFPFVLLEEIISKDRCIRTSGFSPISRPSTPPPGFQPSLPSSAVPGWLQVLLLAPSGQQLHVCFVWGSLARPLATGRFLHWLGLSLTCCVSPRTLLFPTQSEF